MDRLLTHLFQSLDRTTNAAMMSNLATAVGRDHALLGNDCGSWSFSFPLYSFYVKTNSSVISR